VAHSASIILRSCFQTPRRSGDLRHASHRWVSASEWRINLVTESLYLWDRDGLGIEVHTDRPRSAWRRNGREIAMAD
jgi:catechol-2,3-dioxygenase